MKLFRTICAVLIMLLASLAGLFAGAQLGSAVGGAVWGACIAGFACVVYAIDNWEK